MKQIISSFKNLCRTYLLQIWLVQKFIQFILRRDLVAKCKRNIPVRIKQIEKSGNVPLFSHVEIETQNRCNGSCTFCPVNKSDDPREYRKMSDPLFDKIADELKSLNFSGTLCLHSNNEPFMDDRIEGFAEKLRNALPDVHMCIFTNATLLTPERFERIIPFVDKMQIDNYNNNLKFNKTTQAIHEYCIKHPELTKKVKIDIKRPNMIRNTRGGQAPNNNRRKTLPIPCLMPYNQFIIRPDGKISLCCVDALGTYTMGDVSVQSMMDIWHSESFNQIRETLKKGRESLEICKYCDTNHRNVWDIG